MERAKVRINLARAAFYIFAVSACVFLEALIVAMFVSIWVHAKLVSTVLWNSPPAVAICIVGAVLSSQLIADYDDLKSIERRTKDAR